jgi:hypothetical protein
VLPDVTAAGERSQLPPGNPSQRQSVMRLSHWPASVEDPADRRRQTAAA